MKKKMTALLAMTLAAATFGSTAAFAHDDNGKGSYFAKGHYKFSAKFDDVSREDWAIRFITEASSKGYIKGDGYGKFRPSANVSHEESIAMTIRAMGLEDEAKAKTDATLSLKDSASVTGWAKPYVALALEKGLLDKDAVLAPQANADREWITKLVVRAMGLQTDANAHMKDYLTFKDAKEVEAQYVGYIAVAAKEGIINGYLDGTFQPNKPVKRNELAVILCRAEHLFEYDGDRQEQTQGQLNGTLTTVSSTGLTFQASGKQSVTYTFASQYYVFLGEKIAKATDLKAGMNVRVLLNEQGQVVFVQAKPAAPAEKEISSHAIGLVSSYTAPQASAAGSITIGLERKSRDQKARVLTLPVAADVKIDRGGDAKFIQKDTLAANERVNLTIINNNVVGIEVLPTLEKYVDQPDAN
jgi:hypothetical protein